MSDALRVTKMPRVIINKRRQYSRRDPSSVPESITGNDTAYGVQTAPRDITVFPVVAGFGLTFLLFFLFESYYLTASMELARPPAI